MSDDLNPQQQLAVDHIKGPALVLAGAGSGKTRIVIQRIFNLLQIGVPSSEILAVTFTNKAAAEMRHRISKISSQFVLTCTFHSLCARILRESISFLGYNSDFTIYDDSDSEKLIKECLVALNLKDEKGLIKSASGAISQAKNNLLYPEDLMKEDRMLASIYELYGKKLKEYQALDFDDLLFLTVKLLQENADILEMYQKRWTFILIDEYQDTNLAQHRIVKLLGAQHQNIFAVGDPDQSIYSWRGAKIHNILNFENEFAGAKRINLEQNYRSRTNILNAANALIRHNQGRYEKKLWSSRGEGEKIALSLCENEYEEAEFVVKNILKHEKNGIPLNECVVFYRTNFQSRVFEDALIKRQIPYVIIGGLSFYQRREIKDILAFLRIILNGVDFLCFARTINIPKRGFGEATIKKIQEVSSERSLSILNTCIGIVDKQIDVKLSSRQHEGLKSYVQATLTLQQLLKEKVSIQTLISKTVELFDYLAYLKEDPQTFQEKHENIAELISKAAEWESENPDFSLVAFLEELSLKSSSDEKGAVEDSVRLMTIHNGKGLEFNLVFLVGLEEDLFPHINAKESPDAIEEERRLCYVGITRAKEHLYLSASRTRFIWGSPRMMRPSRFLSEIPKEYLLTYGQNKYGTEEESPPLEEGDTVLHRDFGQGIIERIYETSLGTTYDVFFERTFSTRSLVAKYAKLQKIF